MGVDECLGPVNVPGSLGSHPVRTQVPDRFEECVYVADEATCISVTKKDRRLGYFEDGALLPFSSAIVSGDRIRVTRMLDQSVDFAARALRVGASRQDPLPYFLLPLRHHVYAGDTALHIVAAAHDRALAESLVAQGAAVRARNRRGAEPLHYAADGATDGTYVDSDAQRGVIAHLIGVGADPDAMDKNGVAPLHRAVRTRSSGAVSTLIERGADLRVMNKSGSTPLHLAVQRTGKTKFGLGSGQGGTAPNHRVATSTRRQPHRCRCKWQDCGGGRIKRLDP